MHHTHTNLYTAKVPTSFPCGPLRACMAGTVGQDYPVQRPLARLRVMLSRGVVAYYGLIRDSRPSRRLIFFVQRVFALRPRMGSYRELPQFNPHSCSTVPSAVPRRFERLHKTVSSPLALAFASSAQARLTHLTHSGTKRESCNGALPRQFAFATARWIACPTPARAFTFELSPHESPQ